VAAPAISAAAAKPSAAGASSSAPAKPALAAASAAQLPPVASLDDLYQQAKKEGQVSWDASLADTVGGPIADAFMKAYPGITVTRRQITAESMMTDIKLQEAAKHVTLDVGTLTDATVADAFAAEVVTAIDWAKLGLPQNHIFLDKMVLIQMSPNVVVYNKDKIPADQVPKTYDDLVDPKWMGKMAFDGRGSLYQVFLSAPELGGEQKGLEYARKIAAQKPLFQNTQSAVEPMVISGQVLIGSDALPTFLATAKKNPPMDVAPISPIHSVVNPAFVVAGAPHPAAAQLLIAWLGSKEGQGVVNNISVSDMEPCDVTPRSAAAELLCSKGIKWNTLTTLPQFQQLADYAKQIQQILGTYTGS
jgi:iron(III) transport system substrate-binding protein